MLPFLLMSAPVTVDPNLAQDLKPSASFVVPGLADWAVSNKAWRNHVMYMQEREYEPLYTDPELRLAEGVDGPVLAR